MCLSISNAIAAMHTAGCTIEQILSVTKQLESDLQTPTAAEDIKKEHRAARNRRYRDKMKTSQIASQSSHKTSQDVSPSPSLIPSLPPKENSPTPPIRNNPLSIPDPIPNHSPDSPSDYRPQALPTLFSPIPAEKEISRGKSLPEGWQPSAEILAYGEILGLTRKQVLDAMEDLKLWAQANRNRSIARKADWDLTAMGWLRREAAKVRPRYEPQPKKNSYADLWQRLGVPAGSFRAAIKELDEEDARKLEALKAARVAREARQAAARQAQYARQAT